MRACVRVRARAGGRAGGPAGVRACVREVQELEVQVLKALIQTNHGCNPLFMVSKGSLEGTSVLRTLVER